MAKLVDGPTTSLFRPLKLTGNVRLADLASSAEASEHMRAAAEHAPSGDCVGWGIPFRIGRVALVRNEPVRLKLEPLKAHWLVFAHTSDAGPLETDAHGMPTAKCGVGRLGEHAADYFVIYADGSEERLSIRRRRQLGAFTRGWGENCFEAVAHTKPRPINFHHEQMAYSWGRSQTRADAADSGRWINWLWAWKNPHPRKAIVGLRLEPRAGAVVLSAVSAGNASSHPLRWDTRRKAILRLPKGEPFDPRLDEMGLLAQVKLDMGQVITATRRPIYPNEGWGRTYNNKLPEVSDRELLVEYAAHPEARFHLAGGRTVPVSRLSAASAKGPLAYVAPSSQRVTIRITEKGTGRPVPVKLHLHGEAGEYLAPVDRHRIPNTAWFEDYSVDFSHNGVHHCTYIPGVTRVDLPLGRVYLEVSKGFEIRPVRKVFPITPATEEISLELDKVLRWREKGWVSADTHVHFLSPVSALLEGSAEGVNVINLLASQWGELMTNVGDFDGKTTWGAKEAGGDGEYLVRVGTENRQHVLGHISLLGYEGDIIAPMTTAGPDESAIGDPLGCLMTEWARQCKQQNGVVVIPHFPNPRGETAATLITGGADAVEMTAWGNLYGGISPYSLADWYRYLNNGYPIAAVGGTDKMYASTAVGTVRTYAQLRPDEPFTYAAWKDAIRRGQTFVSYGPLVDFSVEGKPAGSRIKLDRTGGRVAVDWAVETVTVPLSRVDLVVNGEIRESQVVGAEAGRGSWTLKLDRSSWVALLVRGHYADKPEIVAAHSSPVMVEVEGSPFFAAADAVSILEQIEGALAYLDTVGTRAEDTARKRMRLVLTSAHRSLHNRLHQNGHYHDHTPVKDHPEHRAHR
ncbi:MAG: CehA/McbA family metallohydrolase [Armatimonadota bacterium]